MTERNLATSINVMERVHKRSKNNNNDDPIEKLKTNITLIYDKNTFYPEPSFDIRKNKNFITYIL